MTAPPQLHAQTGSAIEIGAGAAASVGFVGRKGAVGPYIRLGVRTNRPKHAVNHRLDVEGLRFGAEAPSTREPQGRDAVAAFAVVLSGIVTSPTEVTAPYVIAGVALQGVRDDASDTYPGGFFGLRGGLGVRSKFRDIQLAAEASIQLAVAGFPGGIRKPGVGSFVPVTFSIQF